jgi:hypothetical protein
MNMSKYTKPVVKSISKETVVDETVADETTVDKAPTNLFISKFGMTNPYTLQRFEPDTGVEPIMDSWTECQIAAGIIFPCK